MGGEAAHWRHLLRGIYVINSKINIMLKFKKKNKLITMFCILMLRSNIVFSPIKFIYYT